jgi:hypothetical protein
VPETFSSEIGHVQPDSDRASFNDEFRGASDSLIDRDRPPHPIDIGRRTRRVVFVVMLLAAVFGGGGWALWYWSEPIGEWIASWNRGEAPAPAAAPSEQVEPAQPEPEPSELEPPRVFGVKGAPEGSETTLVEPPIDPSVEPPIDPASPSEPGEGLPVESLDAPPPAGKPASVVLGDTSVRGKVASGTVSSRLAAVDAALEACWASAVAKPETKRPATVKLRFGIKWNGRAYAIAVDGDAPASVTKCVREAVPTSGWPQPRDGGEAQVSRSWSLE